MGNLLHLHSWNYVQTTVTTTEVDTVREPNDAVTATADAASLATAFSEKLPWGVGAAISGVSIANDHSTLNTTTNLLGLIPGYAGPMAVTGAFNDFFDYGAHNSKGTPSDTWKGDWTPGYSTGDGNAGGLPLGTQGGGGGMNQGPSCQMTGDC